MKTTLPLNWAVPDLADVYFAPNSSKKAMTGTVKFTVYGTKSSQKRAGEFVVKVVLEIADLEVDVLAQLGHVGDIAGGGRGGVLDLNVQDTFQAP